MSASATEAASIQTPKCEPGIGRIVRTPVSTDRIRGEIAFLKQGPPAAFPIETTQVSAALSSPDTINAFHFHRRQAGFWVPAQGMFQAAFVDLRPDSPTCGLKNALYAGALKPDPGSAGSGPRIQGDRAKRGYVDRHRPDLPSSGSGPHACHDPSIAYNWEHARK